MNTAAPAVLYAIAEELARRAKDSLPKRRDGERVLREWFSDGVYYRETEFNGEKFASQYDFRRQEKEDVEVENESIQKPAKRQHKSA